MSTPAPEKVTDARILLTQIQSLAHLMAESEISEMKLPSETKISNLQLIEDLADRAEDLLQ